MKKLHLFTVLALGIACTPKQENFKTLAQLPSEIKEASACEMVKNSTLIWTIEDSNNQNLLFGFDDNGKLVKQIRITNSENHDWEDLTSDDEGNIYIGDFGNNDNDRQNLTIYKINAADLNKDEANAESVIQFYYPEQTDFPPKKKDRVFDSEAFFYLDNRFYIFTKNRSSQFDGTTTLYEVDNQPNEKIPAKKLGNFVTCDDFNHCAVTSADISPNKDKVAILTSDKVWLFSKWKGQNFFSGNVEKIELNDYSQKEGLCFRDQNTLLITDEGTKKHAGKLYELKLK